MCRPVDGGNVLWLERPELESLFREQPCWQSTHLPLSTDVRTFDILNYVGNTDIDMICTVIVSIDVPGL